ncbi:MAG TPA: sigma-70 family RNA polymerase sigma factor [Pseudonocardiaceae bacterium]|nr:sigma-70 family RNA polymerase sigma factor [Pseudonocardiaceae bacterium]
MPRLVKFLMVRGATLADATDCVQEALFDAYNKWSSINDLYPWCRCVAYRHLTRRAGRRREHPVEDIAGTAVPLIAPGRDPAAIDARLREYHAMLRLLKQLPSRQREVFAWTYDGASSAEIADVLKITPEAVRASLKKARARLRELLDNEEDQ